MPDVDAGSQLLPASLMLLRLTTTHSLLLGVLAMEHWHVAWPGALDWAH